MQVGLVTRLRNHLVTEPLVEQVLPQVVLGVRLVVVVRELRDQQLDVEQVAKEMLVEQDLVLVPIILVVVEVELQLLVVIIDLLQKEEQVEKEQI